MKIINRNETSNETKPNVEKRQMLQSERNMQSKISLHKTQGNEVQFTIHYLNLQFITSMKFNLQFITSIAMRQQFDECVKTHVVRETSRARGF